MSKRIYLKPSLTPAAKLGAIVAKGSVVVVSDIRLKRDIELVARHADGFGIYSYRYVVGEDRFVGVMAQEVQAVRPDAVITNADGFLTVDYGKLDMEFRRAA